MTRTIRMATIALFTLTCLAAGCASTPETSQQAITLDNLTWDQVAEKVALGGLLVDARGTESFARGHIDGAVNVPWDGGDEAYSKLPKNKETPLIFYCGGPSCSASKKGALAAYARGYEDVAEYKGGYPGWKKLQAE